MEGRGGEVGGAPVSVALTDLEIAIALMAIGTAGDVRPSGVACWIFGVWRLLIWNGWL